MPDPTERIGLEAFLATEVFEKAVKIYTDGIAKMNQVTKDASITMTKAMLSALQVIGTVMAGYFQATSSASTSNDRMTISSMALAHALGTFLYNALNSVVEKMKEFVTGGINAAARVQELGYVLQILGGRAGFSADELNKMVKSIVDMGIQTDEAQNALIQFIKYELNLADATKLARVAQDAAVIGQVNSSDAFQRLIYGITTYNTEVLRTIGVQVNMQQAMEIYAQTINKTSKELTTNERSQAVLNAVLSEGTKIAGAYEAAMEAPGKQIRSLTRDVFELLRVIGEPFLNAYANVVKIMRNLATSFRIALDEGGPLRQIMIEIGGVAEYFTGVVSDLVGQFSTFIKSISTVNEHVVDFSMTITDLIRTFNRGPAAIGLVTAAFDKFKSIVGALLPNLITIGTVVLGIVGAFLAVKVVAGVIAGAFALITTVVSGLAAAFTFLLTPIGLVSAAIVGLVAIVTGVLLATASSARQTFQDIAVEAAQWGANIIQALAEGMIGAVAAVINALAYIGSIIAYWLSPGSPPKIAPDIDKYGQSMMEEFFGGMAGAVDTASPFKKLSTDIDKGFKSLSSTAVNAASNFATNYATVGKKLVDKVSGIKFGEGFLTGDICKKKPPEEVPPKGGGGGGGLPELPKGGIGGDFKGKIEDAVKTAVDNAKKVIQKKMDELLQTLRDKFKPITEAWTNLVNSWAPIVEKGLKAVQIIFDKGLNIDSIQEALKSFLPPELATQIDSIVLNIKTIQTTLDQFAISIGEAFLKMGINIRLGSGTIGGAVSLVLGIIDVFVKGVSVAVAFVSSIIVGMVNGIATAVQWVGVISKTFSGFWTEFKAEWEDVSKNTSGVIEVILKALLVLGGAVAGIVQIVISALVGLAGYVAGWIEGFITFWVDLYNRLVGQSIVPEMMAGIYNSIIGTLTTIIDEMPQKIQDIINSITSKAKDFYNAGVTLITKLKDGIVATLEGIATEVLAWITSIINSIKNFGSTSGTSGTGTGGRGTTSGTMTGNAPGTGGNTVVNNSKTINVSMNPTYTTSASPSNVYFDMVAALMTASI